MAELNTSANRLPQDGRVSLQIDGHAINVQLADAHFQPSDSASANTLARMPSAKPSSSTTSTLNGSALASKASRRSARCRSAEAGRVAQQQVEVGERPGAAGGARAEDGHACAGQHAVDQLPNQRRLRLAECDALCCPRRRNSNLRHRAASIAPISACASTQNRSASPATCSGRASS